MALHGGDGGAVEMGRLFQGAVRVPLVTRDVVSRPVEITLGPADLQLVLADEG